MASNAHQGPRPSRPQNQNDNKNRRNRSQPRPHTSKNDNSELSKALECPVCFNMMTEPIYLCETGHSVCQPCSHKLTPPLCPMCRSRITLQRNFALESIARSTGHSVCQPCSHKLTPPLCPMCRSRITLQRNFALESIARSLYVACHNAEYGCKYTTTPDKLELHYEICRFRQIFCPIGRFASVANCAWHGTLDSLYDHMTSEHPNNTKLKCAQEVTFPNFSLTKEDKDIQLLKMFGSRLFLYHVHINVREKIAYFAIQYLGGKQDEGKWKYQVHIYIKSNLSRKIEVSEICLSATENIEDIFKRGECVAVPLHSLKHYLLNNNSLNFKFFVYSVENKTETPNNAAASNNDQVNSNNKKGGKK